MSSDDPIIAAALQLYETELTRAVNACATKEDVIDSILHAINASEWWSNQPRVDRRLWIERVIKASQ